MEKVGMRSEIKKEPATNIHVEVIIPTLNEEETIGNVIKEMRSEKLPVRLSLLVIDGHSTDKTVEICEKENVRVIKQKGKGKGYAMKEAVENSESDIVVFIDGDGTYSGKDLPSLLEPLLTDQADMVVGSRIKNREKGSISTINQFGNKIFNKTINFALKSKVTDSLSGYRALRREVFRDLILFSTNFEIELEMTVEALGKGYRIHEVPINYYKRKGSQTKLSSREDGIKIAKTLLFIIMNINPMKFFGIIALGFIAMGIVPSSMVLYEYIRFDHIFSIPRVVLAELLFVTAAISLVIGLLSELVVRSRRRLEYLISKKF